MPHHKNLFMHTLHSFTTKRSHYNAVVLCEAGAQQLEGLWATYILPVQISDLHKQNIAPLGSPIYCMEMPSAEIQLQDYSHNFLWLQCCASM